MFVYVQVYDTKVSLYINGTGLGYSPRATTSLAAVISDEGGTLRLGQNQAGRLLYKMYNWNL